MKGLSSAWLCVVGLALLSARSVGEEADAGAGEGAGGEYEVPPVIETTSGQVSGVKEASTKDKTFYSYYGIPYAKPPVGPLRFKDPEMVEPWEGVRDGSKQPPICPQIPTKVFFTGMGDAKAVGQEDCLFLSVFTPKPGNTRALLPIMIFIHGGGWLAGGTYEYPPHVLLNHDVVLVTLQYRLGILGFMSTEDKVAPGNLGLKDQTLAMSWVQKNAEKFGGDPLRITLFGESAGAASVHFQILTFSSIGLFHRGILQSGTALTTWALGKAHKEVAEYLGRRFNCSIPEESQKEEQQQQQEEEGSSKSSSEALVECLQEVDAMEFVTLFSQISDLLLSPTMMGPLVDGDYLAMHPARLMKEARHKRVDLITGISRDEGAFVTLPIYANEALRSSIMFNFAHSGPRALGFSPEDISPLNQTVKIFDRYVGGNTLDETTADNVTRLFTDRFFSVDHDQTASLHAANIVRQKRKVYQYELHHRGQRSFSDAFPLTIGKDWINHCDELFYLFTGGPMWSPLEREEDLKLRDIITTMWTNFAATGNPTPDDALGFKWDPVSKDHLQHLTIKPEPLMEEDYRNETREFWMSLPQYNNLVLNPEKVENLVYSEEEEEKEGEEETEGGKHVEEGEGERKGKKEGKKEGKKQDRKKEDKKQRDHEEERMQKDKNKEEKKYKDDKYKEKDTRKEKSKEGKREKTKDEKRKEDKARDEKRRKDEKMKKDEL